MAFLLRTAINNKELFLKLNNLILKKQSNSPFSPIKIIISQKSYSIQLNLELAKLNGFSSNIKFYTLTEFLSEFLQASYPDKIFPNSKILSWAMFSLLKSKKTGFYDEAKNIISNDIQLYLFCSQIYEDFEQLIENRILDLLKLKNQAQNSNISKTNELWKYFDLIETNFKHFNFINVLDFFNRPPYEDVVYNKFSDLIFWNINRLPDFWLHFFGLCQDKIDFHYFLELPTKKYWIDIKPSTDKSETLLYELGYNKRMLLTRLLNQSLIVDFDDPLNDTIDYLDDSQLEKSDSDYQGSQSKENYYIANIIAQPNFCIEIFQNKFQEVLLTKQKILKLLAENSSLSKSDCLLVVTDLEKYIPALKVFFGDFNNPNLLKNLTRDIDTVGEDFLELCKFLNSKCSTGDLFKILEQDLILKAFELNPYEINQLKIAFKDLDSHWGINGQDLSELGLENFPENTLDTTILKILDSILYSTDSNRSSIKFDLCKTNIDSFGNIFINFLSFYNLIKKWKLNPIYKIETKRSVAEWSNILKKISLEFYGDSIEVNSKITKIVNSLITNSASHHSDVKISFKLIIILLQEKISANLNYQIKTWRQDSIKIIALKDYLECWDKAIFLIGATSDLIAGKKNINTLNLAPQSQDSYYKNFESNQNSNLLNILTNRWHYLHISYTHDNNQNLSANFINQIITFCDEHAIEQTFLKDRRTEISNLAPLNSDTNDTKNESDKLKIFDSKKIPIVFLNPTHTVLINELTDFWSSPLFYFSKKNKIGIYNRNQKFKLGRFNDQKDLNKKINKEILTYLLEDKVKKLDHQDLFIVFKNYFPEGLIGKNQFSKLFSESKELYERIIATKKQFSPNLNKKGFFLDNLQIEIEQETTQLIGKINYFEIGTRTLFNPAINLNWNDLIESYINFLCLRSKNLDYELFLILKKRSNLQFFGFNQEIKSSHANELLKPIIKIFLDHQSAPFLMTYSINQDYIEHIKNSFELSSKNSKKLLSIPKEFDYLQATDKWKRNLTKTAYSYNKQSLNENLIYSTIDEVSKDTPSTKLITQVLKDIEHNLNLVN